MLVELHSVDGTVAVTHIREEEAGAEGDQELYGGVNPLVSKLRELRAKARRLGAWWTTLKDTERALVDAALHLERLGSRLRTIIEEICLKLKQAFRTHTLEKLRELGLRVASTLANFFNSAKLLEDKEYLLYHGLREQLALRLRATPAI